MEQSSARWVFEELAPRFIAENPGFAPLVAELISVDVPGAGAWTVDLRDHPGVRRGLSSEARCTLRIPAEEFDALLAAGTIRAWLDAFTSRRIEFSGHLPTAIKLQRLFAAIADDPQLQSRFAFPAG